MEEKIRGLFDKKSCSVISLEVSSELISRMSKLSVLNTVNTRFTNKEGEILELSNYNSSEKEYEGSSGVGWLIYAIKEYEAQAALEFGGYLLETIKTERTEEPPQAVLNRETKTTTIESVPISVECYFTAEAKEILKFLSEPSFVQYWTGREVKEGNVTFENVVLRNIQAKGDTVRMEYKWKEWKEFGDVEIKVDQVLKEARVVMEQKNVPIAYEGAVKAHWQKRIFTIISSICGRSVRFV